MRCRLLFFLFILPALLRAQGGEAPDNIRTEILPVSAAGAVGDLYINTGQTVVPFHAIVTSLGNPIPYVGPRRLILHQSEAAFAESPPPVPAAWVDLPANADRVMVICSRGPEGRLRLLAHEIATGRMSPGDYRIFNFTTKDIGIVLGDRKAAVKKGATASLRDASWQRESQDLQVKIAVLVEGKSKLGYSSIWGHQHLRRNFIFLYDGDSMTRPVSLCRYYDMPTIKVDAAAGAPGKLSPGDPMLSE